ncbi:hypothetical protein BC360_03005 [Ensifer sp. LC163]|nr:hypothetical protein BC360_03005 [Ensifer sp. LC163]
MTAFSLLAGRRCRQADEGRIPDKRSHVPLLAALQHGDLGPAVSILKQIASQATAPHFRRRTFAITFLPQLWLLVYREE